MPCVASWRTVRGCAGKITGHDPAARDTASIRARSWPPRRHWRAVQRQHRVAPIRERQRLPHLGPRRAARCASSVSIATLPTVTIAWSRCPRGQVGRGGVGRRQQQRRQVIHHDAVRLFRHPPIERAQAGLEMRDGQIELGGDQRRGERRVDVADDDDEVRPLLGEDRLEAEHHRRGLRRVAAAADAEIPIRLRQRQLVEEDLRQGVVVVLAGVDEPLGEAAALRQRGHHRRRLDEVRAGPDDVHQLRHRAECYQRRAGAPGVSRPAGGRRRRGGRAGRR